MEFSWSANTWGQRRENRKEGCQCPCIPVCEKAMLVCVPTCIYTHGHTFKGMNPPPSPSPQSSGLSLTQCEHCQASWGLNLAEGIAGQAAVDALIARTHSLDLQPARHLKPLGSTPKLEPGGVSSIVLEGPWAAPGRPLLPVPTCTEMWGSSPGS